ncbi:hypothetical protein A9Q99_27160 [Gammaproteobacteria bacterium 45_16_T64]|nr:hypothetical protein A9Q99_27160 [Gammaproteobacteria bacterium 45_16_T64]
MTPLGTVLGGILFFFISLLQAATSYADDYIVLDDVQGKIDVNKYLFFKEDPLNSLSLSEFKNSTTLTRLKKQSFNAGFSSSGWWFYLNIKTSPQFKNNTSSFFELHTRYLDYLDIWIYRNNTLIQSSKTGLQRPFSQRAYEAPNFIFPLELDANDNFEIYMHAWGNTTFTMPLAIWEPEALHKREIKEQTIFGMYYGITIVMAFYNLFIFVSTKDRSYIYYVGYVCFLLLFQVAITGFGHQYLWRDNLWILDRITTFSAFSALILGLSFTRYFLHTKENSPKINTTIFITQGIGIVICIACIISPSASTHNLQFPFSYAWITIIVFATAKALLSGYRTARFFALGWFFMIAGVAIKALVTNGDLPTNFFTIYSVMIGSCIEVVLLSIALADRINGLNQDNRGLQQEKYSLLKESSQLKDQFLATISHELRTPMNGVEGSLRLIEHERLPPDIRFYVDTASRSAQEMTALIDRILHFSEVQSGTLVIASNPFDLDKCLRKLASTFKQHCEDKDLQFNSSFAMTNHLFNGDVEKFSELLTIILDNAVKFTLAGSITLYVTERAELSPSQSLLKINIVDTGVGIPERESSALFDPFYQVDNSFSRCYSGLGIGLAIAKGLLSSMEGEMSFVPSQQGTNIELLLPLERALPPSPQTPKILIDSPGHQCHLPMLVVEDNPVNQIVLTRILEKLDVVVLTAENGRKALEVLAEHQVSVIFMDCQMPLMDGFETTRAIRATEQSSGAHLPIIAVTANAMSADKQRCLDSGMDDYLKKPIKPSSIKTVIEKWRPS